MSGKFANLSSCHLVLVFKIAYYHRLNPTGCDETENSNPSVLLVYKKCAECAANKNFDVKNTRMFFSEKERI